MVNKREVIRIKGFTLAEIMIVVAIIAILAVLAIPNLLKAKISANDNTVRSYLRSISTVFEAYAIAHNGCYPTEAADLTEANPSYLDADTLDDTVNHFGHDISITWPTDCSTGNTYTINAEEITNQSEQSWQITTGSNLTRTDS